MEFWVVVKGCEGHRIVKSCPQEAGTGSLKNNKKKKKKKDEETF